MSRTYEEFLETKIAISESYGFEIDNRLLGFELADVILTALNYAKHYNIDIEYLIKEKIKINENRR